MKLKKIVLIGLAALLPAVVRAEDAPKKPWKNATELSIVSANGNTKSQSASGKNTFNYDWTKTSLELIAGGMGAKSQGVTIAEKYNASEKATYKLSEKNYLYEKGGWDKDRFAGIENRYDTSAGLGRNLIKNDRHSLILELGAGYVNEERTNAPVNDFTSGRAYSKYVFTVSPTSNFSQDAEYLHNFENKEDFRVNTETALTAAINAHFALKVSYVWKHVQSPPVGFGRNDTTTGVALVATY